MWTPYLSPDQRWVFYLYRLRRMLAQRFKSPQTDKWRDPERRFAHDVIILAIISLS